MKEKSGLLEMTAYRQSAPGFCGAAALRILLSYFGIKKSEEEIAALCKTTEEHGTHPSDLKKAVRKLGFSVIARQYGYYKILDGYINKRKIPVLVDWWKVDDGHYSVICGLNRKFVWIIDPRIDRTRIIKMSWVTFQRVWRDHEGNVLRSKKDEYLRWWLAAYKK